MSEQVVLVDVADLQRLERLRDIVRVALDPGPWTAAHTEAIKRLAGKQEITHKEIWELANKARCERY